MSWKLEQHGPYYKIYWGNRLTDTVGTKKEVVAALQHYLVLPHNRKICPACKKP